MSLVRVTLLLTWDPWVKQASVLPVLSVRKWTDNDTGHVCHTWLYLGYNGFMTLVFPLPSVWQVGPMGSHSGRWAPGRFGFDISRNMSAMMSPWHFGSDFVYGTSMMKLVICFSLGFGVWKRADARAASVYSACFLFHLQSERVKPAPQEAIRRWGVWRCLTLALAHMSTEQSKNISLSSKRLMYVRPV